MSQPPTSDRVAWCQSAEWRAVARAAILNFHKTRHLVPKCGALARSTGKPCQNLPSPGRTRCRLHGGATPRGDGPLGWHTPAFPGGVPTGKARSDAHKRRRRQKALAREEAMTPEEKARLEAWRASHKPGKAAARARRRQDRESRSWLQELMAKPRQPDTPSPSPAVPAAPAPDFFD